MSTLTSVIISVIIIGVLFFIYALLKILVKQRKFEKRFRRLSKQRSCYDCIHIDLDPSQKPKCLRTNKDNLKSFPFHNTNCRSWKLERNRYSPYKV